MSLDARWAIVAWSLGLGAILIYLSPGLIDPYLVPSIYPDAWEMIWTIWRLRNLSRFGEPLYETTLSFHPVGTSLGLFTMAEGVTWPVVAFLFDVPTGFVYSVCAVVAFVGNFVAARALFVVLNNQHIPSTALAILFAFHPFFIAHLQGGHFHMLHFFPILLVLRTYLRGEHASRVDLFLLVVSIGLLPYISLYYAYFALLVSPVFFRRILTAPGKLIGASLIGALLALPKVVLVARLASGGAYTANHNPARHSTDLLSFLFPGSTQILGALIGGLGNRVNSSESGAYIGYVLLVLALARRPRLALAAGGLFFCLLSLGPVLQISGESFFPVGVYQLAKGLLPFFPPVPARFAILLVLCLFLLAAVNLRSSRLSWILFAVLAVEYFPVSTRTMNIDLRSPALTELRDSRSISAVHDTAPFPQFAMLRQTYHEKRITRAIASRQPRAVERAYRLNPFLRYLEGKSPRGDLERGWAELQVQAIIVERDNLAVIARLESIEWLRRGFEDERLVIYVAR